MLDVLFKYPKVLARMRSGPLGEELDRIAARLLKIGYTRATARIYLARIDRFSRFAAAAGHEDPASIDAEVAERFLLEVKSPSARAGLRTAVGHALRSIQERFPETRPPEPASNLEDSLLAAFNDHLRDVRGLQPRTRQGMQLTARRVLAWYHDAQPDQPLSALTGRDVLRLAGHMSALCKTDRTRSVTTSYVRSFLRYLHWAGIVHEDDGQQVPRTPCWRMAHLPDRLAWDDVSRVVDAIDATGPVGKRDRALLLLLATTGMRSQEVRLLELGDVRWRAGEILVRRTKTRRERVVPLLDEAGQVLAEYVLHGRPRTPAPQVFLCHRPPVRPLSGSGSLAAIVRRRMARCGLRPSRAGAHLLRHSLATRMVEQGRPIKEIADLLGHQSIDTTAIYVKVALPQLSVVALPFPGEPS